MISKSVRRASLTFAVVAALVTTAPASQADTPPASAAASAGSTIRPDVARYLEGMRRRGLPPMSDAFIAMVRKIPSEQMAKMMSSLDQPLGALAVDRQLTMPGPGGTIALRLFDARAERPAGPVVVFYHGGGFVVGAIATHAPLAAEISRQLDLPVISVEYRLAPEAKWPAPADDAEAAARWIAANGKALGREVTGLVLSGDSAGGTLTLSTALALRDHPATAPVIMMVPFYPMADASHDYPSMQQFSDGYGLSAHDIAYYGQALAPDTQSPRYSTLLADLHGLPPTVLGAGSLDPLRDGDRAFAAKLIASGVPTAYYEAQGMIHGYATYRQAIPSAQGDLDRIMDLARGMLAVAHAK